MPTRPPCQAEACALQNCLTANTYNPERCDKLVQELYTCCDEMYRRDGRDADSSACPRQSAVERWLEKHRDDKVKKKGADQRR